MPSPEQFDDVRKQQDKEIAEMYARRKEEWLGQLEALPDGQKLKVVFTEVGVREVMQGH